MREGVRYNRINKYVNEVVISYEGTDYSLYYIREMQSLSVTPERFDLHTGVTVKNLRHDVGSQIFIRSTIKNAKFGPSNHFFLCKIKRYTSLKRDAPDFFDFCIIKDSFIAHTVVKTENIFKNCLLLNVVFEGKCILVNVKVLYKNEIFVVNGTFKDHNDFMKVLLKGSD